jgi:hypothetical protein
VTELKEPVKADKGPAIEKEGTVDEAIEKAQVSKAGQDSKLEGGETAGTGRTRVSQFAIPTNLSAAVLPEKTTKEPATLAERPKTAETTAPIVAPVVAPVAAPEPIPAPSTESDVAHVKRPYEKPIFNNEEDLKPHKMPKTEEEQLAASAAEDKKTIENLAGAGPASTAAYTAPEPVPVKTEAPKAEEKKVAEAPKVAEQKPEEKIPVETPKSTTQAGKAPASNPDAVAAANAAIASKSEKAAAPVAEEPKKPEAALKRGEEPLPKSETPKEGETEQALADETQTSEPSEPTEEKKKKEKGGFLSWLKRKFK